MFEHLQINLSEHQQPPDRQEIESTLNPSREID